MTKSKRRHPERDFTPTHPNAAAIDIGSRMHVAAATARTLARIRKRAAGRPSTTRTFRSERFRPGRLWPPRSPLTRLKRPVLPCRAAAEGENAHTSLGRHPMLDFAKLARRTSAEREADERRRRAEHRSRPRAPARAQREDRAARPNAGRRVALHRRRRRRHPYARTRRTRPNHLSDLVRPR